MLDIASASAMRSLVTRDEDLEVLQVQSFKDYKIVPLVHTHTHTHLMDF